jgi:ABC-2 type transport system permease protein
MKKTLLVLQNELRRVVGRRSFILTLVLVPLVAVGVYVVANMLGGDSSGNAVGDIFAQDEPAVVMEGIVDQGGIVQEIPADVDNVLQAYPDYAAAEAALGNGEISAFYVISPDYLETGQVAYYRPDYNPMSEATQSGAFESTLTYNLLNGDEQLAGMIDNPLANLERRYLSSGPQRDPGDMLTFFLPYAVTMLFYIIIFSSASLMLNSITDEKQNRVIEILMTSVTPTQLLTGKIIALGLVGLLQTLVWAGTGYAFLRLGGTVLNISEAFQLPLSILLWGIVFFLLGYGIYASLMAGIGALVPNLREASQATIIIVIPLVIPLTLISILSQDPNGTISTVLSMFPLTAPVAMMTRMSATTVPLWQILLTLVLLFATAALIIRSVAGMFRAQNLLSGRSFSLKVFARALFGRA